MRKVRAQEYLKCARDPIYFMQEYVYIVHQEKGLIQFDLFDFQKRTLRDLREYRFNIILKARQMGVTTLLSAYSLWLMLFNENKGVLALSYKQDKAKNIVTKVKRMHANLPSWMKEQLEIDNQLAAVFSNGSKIEAEATTSEAGRSESVSFVIIDEAAFVDNAEDVWGAVKLTLDVGNGNCAVLSTPTGVGTWFHESWQKAMQGDEVEKLNHDPEIWDGIGENRFHPIKLHWSLHPGRGQDWRDEQDDTMGEKKAARECFDGDTKIYTDEGLVPIRDVEVGDSVLTHKGRFREVSRTFEKEAETLAFNTSLNKRRSRVTPDHPVLDLDEQWNPFESFGEGDKLSHFPYGNGEYSVCRINEVEDGGQTTVYNLEVEEDHTYVTEHFVAHNCDCDFSTSGDTVIRQEIIQWYADNAVEEPMEVHRKGKGEVWLWEPPDPDKVYIMASDVARGDGTDYSTFQIYKAREMEQVAEYKGKMPPGDFGDLLTTYGTMFNDALLVIERDSYGWAAMQQVIDRGYPNLLYTSNDLKLVEIDRDAAMSYNDDKVKPGLDTNTNTRGLIISRLQEFMRKRWIRMKSERLTDELRTFIWKNKGTRQKPEHMDGYNDDLIFAAAFACWVRDKALRYRAELQQRSKESLSNIQGNKLAYSPNSGPGDPYSQNVGGESEDLRWLLD